MASRASLRLPRIRAELEHLPHRSWATSLRLSTVQPERFLTMQIKIPDKVTIEFTGKGVAYVIDLLSGQPFKDVHGLINDILSQLKAQESGPPEPS